MGGLFEPVDTLEPRSDGGSDRRRRRIYNLTSALNNMQKRWRY